MENNANQVEEWIRQAGLESHKQKFLELGYDTLLTCAYLEDTDLDVLGINLPGKRRSAILHSRLLREKFNLAEKRIHSTPVSPQSHHLGNDFYTRALPTRLV
jgi:hypothetical protein